MVSPRTDPLALTTTVETDGVAVDAATLISATAEAGTSDSLGSIAALVAAIGAALPVEVTAAAAGGAFF